MRKAIGIVLLLALALAALAGCGGHKETAPAGERTEKTLADFRTARIGALSGTTFPGAAAAAMPEAEVLQYMTTADEINALKSGKVDAILLDEPVARNMVAETGGMTILPEMLETFDSGFVFAKNEVGAALCAEMNAFLRAQKADGMLTALQEKWFDAPNLDAVEMTDYRDLPNRNGTLQLASYEYPPFTFRREDAFAGYEIELIALFCRERGYALDIIDMSFPAILPAVQTGKCDVGCSCIANTPERSETVRFSEPDYSGGTVLLVRSDEAAEPGAGFLRRVAESFEKTFVRENRWKLFLQGIGTTLLITAASIMLGTALGFGTYLLCRKGNPIVNAVTRFCFWLVKGMPAVVLLMILYYIIFGKADISGTAVSIVAFTLVFGASAFGMLRSGVGAVPISQTEAAYALGYSDRRAFFRVVLPQAMPHFFPTFKGQITSLIKATSIVGYVAAQDLTKMGDIVRSRTYEAFFPLIAIAVIYFILAGLLTAAADRLIARRDPRRRRPEEILKDVRTQEGAL